MAAPSLIAAVQKDDALVADVECCDLSAGGIAVWWLGQSGFLVKAASGRLLFDPYLSDSLTKKYASTDKPHVRISEQVVAPDRLTGIDAITSTHNHTDHLDAETLVPMLLSNPGAALIIPEANRSFVADRLGVEPTFSTGLNDGQSTIIGPWTIHAIAAAHNEVDRDAVGHCRYLGYVATVETAAGKRTVYHAGDTLWHDGLVEQLAPFEIDIAILPINGNLPTRRVSGNLWGQEAATLAREIGAKLVVPCHFNLFAFNTQTPIAFEEACRELDQPYQTLRLGERVIR